MAVHGVKVGQWLDSPGTARVRNEEYNFLIEIPIPLNDRSQEMVMESSGGDLNSMSSVLPPTTMNNC